jgi:hypothetical protein
MSIPARNPSAHGCQQDRPIHRKVDDAGALGNCFTQDGEKDRRSRRQYSRQTNQDNIRLHGSS